MMKPIFLGLLLISLAGFGLLAQTFDSGDPFGARGLHSGDPSPKPKTSGGKKKTGTGKGEAGAAATPQGPTVIDSQNMDYDEKTRIAIFTGEDYGVFVKDPSFTVNCDKLTAYMRKAGAAASPGAKPKVTPAPVKGKAGAAGAAPPGGGGLQRAIAEGVPDRPVVIVQDKPAASPGETPQHNVGIALKADYNTDTGDVILTGWPRVSQGINTQIATAPYTVMTMNRDGHTMKTRGPSRTVIQEEDQPKTSGTDSSDSSSSPTPQ